MYFAVGLCAAVKLVGLVYQLSERFSRVACGLCAVVVTRHPGQTCRQEPVMFTGNERRSSL